MAHNPKKSIYLQQQFETFDHFADTIREFDLDFRQLDRGSFFADLRQVETDSVLVTKASFNRKLEQRGGVPTGKWTFAILEPSSPKVVWYGQKISNQMLMVYAPGSEVDAVSPSGFNVLTLSIPITALEEWTFLNKIDGRCELRSLGRIIRIDRSNLRSIRRTANRLITAAESNDQLIHVVAKDVLSNILESLPTAVLNRPKASTSKKSRILKFLNEYIEAHLDEHITLLDLCSVAKASPRTVQRTFNSRFGVTPKEYIQAQRLNQVHRDLLEAKSRRGKVSDIANRWGFWHMGQFASDYRRFYGELPSETLTKSKR